MTPDHLPQRIHEKIAVVGDCWIWRGCNSGNGYGKISVQGRMKMAHRHVYEVLVGPVPEGMVLDHLCRNRACVNPNHMEPVTIQVNTHRGEAKLFAKRRFASDDYDEHAKRIQGMPGHLAWQRTLVVLIAVDMLGDPNGLS